MKIFRILALGNWKWLPNFPSLLLLCVLHRLQPPMLWSTRQVPVAPLVWDEAEDVVLWLQPGKRVSGVCYFCCPIASTWVAQGWVFIMLAGQVVRSYGEEGGCEWSMHHHHRDSVSTASVSRPPGSVKNHTLGCLWGRWDTNSQLLISFPSSQLSQLARCCCFLTEEF